MSVGGSSFTYNIVGARPAPRAITTSRREIRDIGVSFVVLTVCLMIIFGGYTLLFGTGQLGFLYTFEPLLMGIAALAALSGFVAHELAHKVVAERRGYPAEFRMWVPGLLISLATAFFGILWGAPGATVVSGMPYEEAANWGKTSVAGPMANVAFAAVFYAASIVAHSFGSVLFQWLLLLAWINGWFGTFNLLPFGPLDGRKVLRWSPSAWVLAIALTGAAAVLSWLALFSFNNPLLAW